MKLENAKHERFCQEYIIDLNGAKAYERTYGKVKAARVMASKLLSKANIQTRIAELKEIRSERTVVTQDMIVKELMILALSDFRDYGEVVDPYGTKTTKRLKLKIFKEIKGNATKAIKSISEHVTKDGIQLKYQLHGKEKPLELLGKHIGMFVDEHKHSGTVGLKITAANVFEALKEAEKEKNK